MRIRNEPHAYGALARVMHWTTVALVAWLYIGISGLDLPPKNLARDAVVTTHVLAGAGVFLLMAVRLLWRFSNPNPVASYTLTRLHRAAVYVVHYTLYALVLAACVSGLIAVTSEAGVLTGLELGDSVGVIAASLCVAAEDARTVHAALTSMLLLLALVHATAAVVNQIVGVPAPSDAADG